MGLKVDWERKKDADLITITTGSFQKEEKIQKQKNKPDQKKKPTQDLPKKEDPNIKQEKPQQPKEKIPQDPNQVIQEIIDLVNAERIKAGVQPLEAHPALMSGAEVRAYELKSNFSHTRPDGTDCFTAIEGQLFARLGENIGQGYLDGQKAMVGWMNSPGHRANILNPRFRYIGVGVDLNHQGYVQMFGGELFSEDNF